MSVWRLLSVRGKPVKPRAAEIDGKGRRCAARLMSAEARANSKKLGRSMHDQCYREPKYEIDGNVYCTKHAQMIALKLLSGEIDHG